MDKKKNLITAICLAVLAICILVWICLPKTEESQPTLSTFPEGSTGTRPSEQTTQPTYPKVGQVVLYTCDLQLHSVYTNLAEEFSQDSGLPVLVLPLPQEDCAQALMALLESDTPPTVFCIHDEQTLTALQPQLADLSGTELVKKLSSSNFALREDKKVLAVAGHVEAYGLIYNTSLMGKAGFSRGYFTDISALENAVKHITTYRTELGFSAFGTLDISGTDHEDPACRLTLMYQDPEQMRRFLDLQRSNTIKTGDALSQFLTGKAVFYLGSSQDYEIVADLSDGAHNLDILPVLSADGGKMQYVCQLYWAVSGGCSQEDLAATLAFMQWLVTAGRNGTPVDQLQLMSPYKDATYYGNILQRKLRGYMAGERIVMHFPRCQQVSQAELETLSKALMTYLSAPNDTNWAAVEEMLKTTQE